MDKSFNEYVISSPAADERIAEGIERNRKGWFKVVVTGADGKRADARVRVKQKSHEFKFGCNMFMLDEIPDDENKNETYKRKLKSTFNAATLPFYWDATEPKRGETRYDASAEKIYRRPPADLCVDWCEKNGVEPREHGLCYDHFFPDWIKNESADEIKRALDKRMREISERYAHRIPTIEVTNEMFWGEGSTFYRKPEFVEWCFKNADGYFPTNKLAINEGTYDCWGTSLPRNPYYLYVKNALLAGARIDLIGMQFHMFYRRENYFNATRTFYDLDRLYAVLDRFKEFGKPIEITEVTIPAFSGEADDEELQADVIEKLYSLWFSHENVEKIIYWNLADGYAAFTEPGNMTDGENYYYGGLLRFDMSEKPAYKRLSKLIRETWHTDVTVNGDEFFKAFYGDYELEVTALGKTTTVPVRLYKDSARTVSVVID